MAVYLDEGEPLAEVRNPVDGIIREASSRHFGAAGPSRVATLAALRVPPAQFETGVDEDGNDLDFFITEEDFTEDAARLTSP